MSAQGTATLSSSDLYSYQPGGSAGFIAGSGIDPLSNGTLCLRDAALMQRLGINTIRVYNLDPSLNHGQSSFSEILANPLRHFLSLSRSMCIHFQCSGHLHATRRQLAFAQ